MFSFLTWFLPNLPEWLSLDANPLESLLQGVVGACGISILCNLLRVHVFLDSERDEDSNEDKSDQKKSSQQGYFTNGIGGTLQFCLLTGILSVVSSRVASLVVLEFTLRAVLAWFTAGFESSTFLRQQLIQCQFSLGCALSCSLHFLHEGAAQRWLCLLLAAALSSYIAKQAVRLHLHVKTLYKLHSTQRYCGVCISLLSSGSSILPSLNKAIVITFTVAAVAAISVINKHFLSATEALRFWTPLTICYTLLVVYMQEEQHRQSGGQAVLNTVGVRLGALMVLMLTIGRWVDVVHIFVCFLGEAACLIPTKDLLDATSEEEEQFETRPEPENSRIQKTTRHKR